MASEPLPSPIAWMKLHERTIIVFGALLFIGTFVIKEVVGDNVKDLQESIARETLSFRIRVEFIGLRERINRVQKEVENVEEKVYRLPRKKGDNDEFFRFDEEIYDSKTVEMDYLFMRAPVDEQMENIADLTAYVTLPDNEAKNLEYDKQYLVEAANIVRSLAARRAGGDETEKAMTRIKGSVGAVASHLATLVPILLPRAKETEHHEERVYEICKLANGLCFILGLGLAVIGRIYHFEVFGGPS